MVPMLADRLLAVWQNAPDAMALSDAAGVVLDVNPAYCALYGYASAELIGADFAVIFPEAERPAAQAVYREVFAGTAAAPAYEATVRRRDGTERIVEARVSFLTAGTPPEPVQRVAMLSIVRDVTDLVAAKRELDAALAREQQALTLRNQVLAQVSHDLKNSVTGILGGVQLLQRQLARADGGKDPTALPQLAAGLDQIVGQARGMAADLNELLDTAQLAAGQPLALGRQATDLVALVRQAVAETPVSSDRYQLHVAAAVGELVGEWDRYRLERVLRNLLANAVKYSPGGGTITLTVAPIGSGAAAGAELTIQDEGIGIPAADLPRIFERFYRGQNAIGWTAGTGLGLAGVRDVVEQHGGTISVESEAGVGSKFIVHLPRNA